jgi:phage tail sheath protein FI
MVLSNIKTPGVYVEEVPLFPPSVAQVPTAIPAFIGYTEFAKDTDGNPLSGKPTKIKSLLEFATLFGKEHHPDEFKIVLKKDSEEIKSITADKQFYLYNALRQFYDNGGGECYIVSVGNFSDTLSRAAFAKGIDELKKFDAPTLISFPDAVAMMDANNEPDYSEIAELHKQSLAHCAAMQDRFSIFDLAGGDKPTDTNHNPVESFRDNVGVNALSYGAAYYPWVVTNYEFTPRFRQIKLEIDNDPAANTAVTLEKLKTDFSKDAAEKDLLKDYTNKDGITTGFIQKLYPDAEKQKAFTKTGIEFLKKELLLFETAVQQSDGTTHKDQLKAYLDQLAALVTAFPKIAADLAGDAAKLDLINAFKNNLPFIKTIKLLIAIEKDPETLDNTGRSANDLKNTVYKDVLVDWTGGVAFDDLKLDELDETIDPSVYIDTKAGTLIILDDVKKKVTSAILNAYDSLFYQLKISEQQMLTRHSFLKGITDKLKEKLRTIPPSGTVAGIYAQVDNNRGVWKAPANISVASIIGPAVKIDNKEQEDLNVSTTGKSINAIRSFTGKGTLVWGARTLAGNDNEWRYVPVRRFFIMVEESVKKATEPFVFENNDANTWVKVKAMIENFLTLQWRAGALQGAKTEDAFFVHIGLGETMTQDDLLNGRMIVEIGMAVVRPAEFIILRFSHKMMEQ